MQRYRLDNFTKGWYIGNFLPAVLHTKAFEVALKKHKQGEDYERHSQRTAYEYNLLVQGMLSIGDERFVDGDIFVIFPGEMTKPVFHTDCTVVCVKVPSLPNDKEVADA